MNTRMANGRLNTRTANGLTQSPRPRSILAQRVHSSPVTRVGLHDMCCCTRAKSRTSARCAGRVFGCEPRWFCTCALILVSSRTPARRVAGLLPTAALLGSMRRHTRQNGPTSVMCVTCGSSAGAFSVTCKLTLVRGRMHAVSARLSLLIGRVLSATCSVNILPMSDEANDFQLL